MDSSFSSRSSLLGVTSALVFLVACGGLSVDTGNSKQTYHDSFYACTGTGKPYVDNIDGLLSLLFPLAKP